MENNDNNYGFFDSQETGTSHLNQNVEPLHTPSAPTPSGGKGRKGDYRRIDLSVHILSVCIAYM